MSRIAAVHRRIEAIIAQTTPETRLSFPRFQLGVRTLANDADQAVYGRRFIVVPTGALEWLGEVPQDREGALVSEGFTIEILYPPADSSRRMDIVMREDAIRLQYELLAPDNWLDDAAWKCQRRLVNGYQIISGDTDQDADHLTIPVTVVYRPF